MTMNTIKLMVRICRTFQKVIEICTLIALRNQNILETKSEEAQAHICASSDFSADSFTLKVA